MPVKISLRNLFIWISISFLLYLIDQVITFGLSLNTIFIDNYKYFIFIFLSVILLELIKMIARYYLIHLIINKIKFTFETFTILKYEFIVSNALSLFNIKQLVFYALDIKCYLNIEISIIGRDATIEIYHYDLKELIYSSDFNEFFKNRSFSASQLKEALLKYNERK